jgi:hypothetical protein
MEAHLTRDLPDPRNWVADLPAVLCDFIRKATQKRPDERYNDMSQVLDALRQISSELGLSNRIDGPEERKMMSLFLFYREDQRRGLNALLEEFSRRVREAGVQLKAADFKDIG